MTTAQTNSNLSGIDFSQYANWPKVTTASGGVYYVVPGTAYVYDPFLSSAKGRPVLFRNPQPGMDAQKKQEDAVKKAQSPLGQIAPIAGTVGGTVAANQLISHLSPATALEKLAEAQTQQILAQTGQQTAANAFTQAATGAPLTQTSMVAPPQIIDATRVGAPEMGPGGLLQVGSTAGNIVGGAGLGLGAYEAFQGIKNHNPLQAGLGGLGGVLGANQLGWALGPWGIAASIGIPAAMALFNNHKSTKEIEADRWKGTGHTGLEPGHDFFAGTGGEKSRDEKFLTPDAIRMNPDNYHNIPDWDQWDKTKQDKFLSQMLSEGKVREKKGGIYYDDKRAQELADIIRKGGALPSLPGTPTTPTNGVPEIANVPARSSTKSPGIGLDGQKVGKQLASRINERGR